MPYIKKLYRGPIDDLIKNLPSIGIRNISVGELNYLITRICLFYLDNYNECYEEYNSVVGVLECVKQELYRRRIVPYEEKKQKENGEVYGPENST